MTHYIDDVKQWTTVAIDTVDLKVTEAFGHRTWSLSVDAEEEVSDAISLVSNLDVIHDVLRGML